MDIAAAWADSRVYDIVKIKYDSLPAPNDKKKGGKGGGSNKKGGKATPVTTEKVRNLLLSCYEIARVSISAFLLPG